MKYWQGQGKYMAQAEELEQLTPVDEVHPTLAGELFFAGAAIYHEAYNNGFMNNRTGAYNFLKEKMAGDVTSPEFWEALELIEPYMNPTQDRMAACSMATENEDVQDALDTMMDFVIATAMKHVDTPNTEDFYDYEEPDADVDDYDDAYYAEHNNRYGDADDMRGFDWRD